ncbi:MAG TPA: hypothetical protein VMN99_01250 [Anaerolineales bacterium]|nr:hypothetical protein [Anaerolineales bacterium]
MTAKQGFGSIPAARENHEFIAAAAKLPAKMNGTETIGRFLL